jgi:AcrR family transcriptional regulator
VSNARGIVAGTATGSDGEGCEPQEDGLRARIMDATFSVLMERGYSGATTREIARRAKVSKRELYAQFGSKQGILAAMIAGRVARMRLPLALPEVKDRGGLADILARFGAALIKEVCHPAVLALFRLAIIEGEHSPEVARALDEWGRRATRIALADFLARAQSRGVIEGGKPDDMAGQFLALLWTDLQIRLLMCLAEAPTPEEIERRALTASRALLALYPARSSNA